MQCHPQLTNPCVYSSRLRQIDLKAEHFERQVHTLEQESAQWEKKYEVWQTNRQLFSLLTLC